MTCERRKARRVLFLEILACLLAAIVAAEPGFGEGAAEEKSGPVGQVVLLDATMNSETLARVSRAAIDLREQADKEGRQAILVLEIQEGVSRYGDIREIAKFISTDIPQVRTIAWIPRDLRGMNGIVALACHEIVMAPTAGFGDIGRGGQVDADTQAFTLSLVDQRRNPLLSKAIVEGMLEQDQEVIWLRIRTGDPNNASYETRVVDGAEFRKLSEEKAVIEDRRTLKAAGSNGLFLGGTCRELNVLTSNVFDNERMMLTHYRLGQDSVRDRFTAGEDPKVALILIQGVIDTMYEEYLHRQIERQIAAGTNMLIFEVDSPGGMLEPCVRLAEIFASCSERKVRTVVYVPRQAISGGAIVSFGCDEIYMHADALIGDAQPIEVRPGEAFSRVSEKILSKVVQDMQVIAERKHRPVALLQAMADKDLEVFKCINKSDRTVAYLSDLEIAQDPDKWEKGPMVPESKQGMILTLNGQRAYELTLADKPVRNFEELKDRLQIPAKMKLVPQAPMFVDRLVFLLNTPFITGMLLFLGIVCIYMEMHIPSGLFAIGGVLCFALFFWSRFLGGTAGWLEVMLFLVGLACLALEVFVLPGFGVFGVSGGLLVIISLILAGQTFWVPVTSHDFEDLSRSMMALLSAVVVFAGVAYALGRFLPRSRLWDHMVLVPPGGRPIRELDDPILVPSPSDPKSGKRLVGARGEALSNLRPAGKARFGDDYLGVVSEGPFIDIGSQVEVVAVEGMRIVVRKVT